MAVKNGVFTGYSGAGGAVVIPNGVTSIGARSFKNCQRVTSVVIPEGVTSIGDYAFYFCTKLRSVTIPKSVTSIGRGAFDFCWELKSVTVPANATIGYNAFSKDCKVIRGGSVSPSSDTRVTSSSTSKTTATKPASGSPPKTTVTKPASNSATKTSSTPRVASPNAPAMSSSNTTVSSGNDFLSQVRKNSIENSPENVLRRRDEAEARAQDKIRRDTESAISIEYVDVVKKEVLHYAPYYWYTNQNGQCECAGEIVLSCSGSSNWRDDFKSLYAWIGPYPSVSVNWYGEPRMNKNEMPYFVRPPILDYYEKKAQGGRLDLIRKVFNPSVECIKQDYGVLFKKYDISYVLHGETLFEKIFLRKLKDALGSAVSIVPCAPEIQATYPSPPTKYCIHDLKMNRVYKFKFVF